MNDAKAMKPATLCANLNGYLDPQTGGLVPPIQPSSTFARDADYALLNPDFVYARDENDTVRVAEDLLAKLEGAEEALLLPSGMAAIAAVFRTLKTGGVVLLQSQIYWGTTKWVRDFCVRRNIECHEIDASDAEALQQACETRNPDLVFIETPSNPWLRTVDIRHAADVTHRAGGILVVDSTAATPVLSQPLGFGADIVMHSATKGINGHSDVVAGVLATADKNSLIWQDIKTDRHDAGAILGPFEAWLLIRGLRTLPLRMERASDNALKIAEHLDKHPQVEAVYYPGLAVHHGHEIATRQMKGGFGCLLSFLVRAENEDQGRARALKVAGALGLFHRATSLGGVESLVEHRHTIESHTGIPTNLLRISVGIEAVEDLIADLDQALEQADRA